VTPLLELEPDDEIVRNLLRPLARVEPVALIRKDAGRRLRPRMLIAAAVGTAILLFAGLAVAGAVGPLRHFGPLHHASISPNPPTFACGFIGETAGQAAPRLHERGYQIKWLYQHWATQVVQSPHGDTPGAVTGGYTAAPATVPADSVVWNIDVDTNAAMTLDVFVEAPNDPNAPAVIHPKCQSR
jgi:hypothetical protein